MKMKTDLKLTEPIEEKTKYWFPAKKYGVGWGLPSAWQGWVTFILFLGSVPLSIYLFPPGEELLLCIVSMLGFAVLFLVVCWVKGAPLKWRWGKD